MFGWFALCFTVFAADSFISVISSLDTTGNGTLLVQVALAREYCHMRHNVAVVLSQKTQLAVFPFVDLTRELTMPWSPWAVFLEYHL